VVKDKGCLLFEDGYSADDLAGAQIRAYPGEGNGMIPGPSLKYSTGLAIPEEKPAVHLRGWTSLGLFSRGRLKGVLHCGILTSIFDRLITKMTEGGR
jgi:hypothetical protein